jgi:hypothetical protein
MTRFRFSFHFTKQPNKVSLSLYIYNTPKFAKFSVTPNALHGTKYGGSWRIVFHPKRGWKWLALVGVPKGTHVRIIRGPWRVTLIVGHFCHHSTGPRTSGTDQLFIRYPNVMTKHLTWSQVGSSCVEPCKSGVGTICVHSRASSHVAKRMWSWVWYFTFQEFFPPFIAFQSLPLHYMESAPPPSAPSPHSLDATFKMRRVIGVHRYV